VRRAVLILLVISAAGFLFARAATFTTEAEDIATYMFPNVSISVPEDPTTTTTDPCPALAMPSPVLLRTLPDPTRNILHPAPPPADTEDEASRSVAITYSGDDVDEVSSPGAFVTWSLISYSSCGYRITGTVRLFIGTFFFLLVQPQLRAQLFRCPLGAPPASRAEDGCSPIGSGSAGGFIRYGIDVVQVNLGAMNEFIPADVELRLKVIVSRSGIPLSSTPILRWGYVDDDVTNDSRLTVTNP
jgi:hypothetical protein